MIGRWGNHRPLILTGLLALFLLASPTAYAACTNPAAGLGTIVYNADQNVPQVCTSSGWVALGTLNPAAGGGSCSSPSAIEGAIVYNNDFDVLQYCDGTNWIAIGQAAAAGGGCTPDPTCPNVGDVCSGDSSGGGNPKFAGCVCYYDANSADDGTCKALYVSQSDIAAQQWNIATGTDDIATDSAEDGKINDGQIANSTTFPAFKTCKDLTDGGYTDWYLPALPELDRLWYNQTPIGGFSPSNYWTSTEYSTTGAWTRHFTSSAGQGAVSKTNSYHVRCVRRD